jgi:hypothetical protein
VFVDRLHHLAGRARPHTDDVAEHQAEIDLLVLTAYSDHRISQAELDALEALDEEHRDWDDGAFSARQYLPVAVAKVRAALEADDGVARLLADAASRIATPAGRQEALEACRVLAAADGAGEADTQFLASLQTALG